MGNVGDDLLLRAALSALRGHEVGVLLEPPAVLPDFAIEHRVLRWPRLSGQQLDVLAVRRFRSETAAWDKLVFFGGGWLAADRDIATIAKWYARTAIARVPVVGFALGIGPFHSLARPLARPLLARFGALSVRSASDASELAALTGRRAPIVGDGAILQVLAEEIRQSARSGVVVAAPRPYDHWLPPKRWSEYGNRVLQLARCLAVEDDEVQVVSFEHPADTRYWREFADVTVLRGADEAVRLVSSARVLVAGRLHAGILAFLTDTPVVPLAYHHKFDVLRELGYQPVDIAAWLDGADSSTPQLPTHPQAHLEKLREISERELRAAVASVSQ